MVSFLRVPYALALERGEVQRGILLECCAGKQTLDEVDLDRADALVMQRLAPLETA